MILTKEGNIEKANWGQRAVIWLSDRAGISNPHYNRATADQVAGLVKQCPTLRGHTQAQTNLRRLRAEFIKHSSHVAKQGIKAAFKRAVMSLASNPTGQVAVSVVPGEQEHLVKLLDRFLPTANSDVQTRATAAIERNFGQGPYSGKKLIEVRTFLSRLGLGVLIQEFGLGNVEGVLGGRSKVHQIADGAKLLDVNAPSRKFAGGTRSVLQHLREKREATEVQREVQNRCTGRCTEEIFAQMATKYSHEAVRRAKEGLTFEQLMYQTWVEPKSFETACRAAQSRITTERACERSQALDYIHNPVFSEDARGLLSGATSVENVKEKILFGFEDADEAQCVDRVRTIFAPDAANRIIGEALRLMEIGVDAKDLPKINGAVMSELLQMEAEDFDYGRLYFDCRGALLGVVRAALYPVPQKSAS
jgi:hypothetical protein